MLIEEQQQDLVSCSPRCYRPRPSRGRIALRWSSSTVACSGPSFFCNDNGGVCCSLPTGFGFSVQFANLPAGTQGQGYTGNTCGSFMNWFNSPQGGRRNVIASRANNFTCGHSGFTYHDDSGVERSIKVPLGEAEVIVESYTEKDFAKLASYETNVLAIAIK